MIIHNRNEIATSDRRQLALDIVEAGIRRVLPETCMKSTVTYDRDTDILSVNGTRHPLSGKRVFVIGGGKASGRMAETLVKILGAERIYDGLVTCVDSSSDSHPVRVARASHPVPDQKGVEGVKQMLAFKQQYAMNENDMILCLISGGGSALMPLPVDGIELDEKQELTRRLLTCGADIHDINTVRKHLSGIKGGRLGAYFRPSTIITLIISDVVGNDLDVIASGPTAPDPTTYADAYDVLLKYDLISITPKSILHHIEQGVRGDIEDTPTVLDNCRNHIIGENRDALEAMALVASKSGFSPVIVTSEQKGDSGDVARILAEQIRSGTYGDHTVILVGGETTPSVPVHHGRGGRNQHLAASAVRYLDGYEGDWTLVSIGTDGSDFLPDIAGAVVDHDTLSQALKQNIDIQQYLNRYDSYTLLKRIGGSLIRTGNTGTNVGDCIVVILN